MSRPRPPGLARWCCAARGAHSARAGYISGVDPRDDDVMGYLDRLVTPLMKRMSAFPAPTFAAAHGACLGVGLGLLIATDVVYVAESAKIGSPFAALGATLDSGGHALFFERLGAHRTLDLIYTGRLMSGTEAVTAGLFSRVFPDDEVTAATIEAAEKAASGATQAFRASKALVAQAARRATRPLAGDGCRERRAGGPLRHRRLPRGLRRVPGEAHADLPRLTATRPATSPLRRAWSGFRGFWVRNPAFAGPDPDSRVGWTRPVRVSRVLGAGILRLLDREEEKVVGAVGGE